MTRLERIRHAAGGEGSPVFRGAVGTITALASMAALTAATLPLRAHLSIATTALVLIVPVVIGVITGGFVAGVISVVAGFLVYVFFFIPPYLTWYVGRAENWVPLGIYAVVMVPVAKVVSDMNSARTKERRRSKQIRELFELSDLLVADKPLDELLSVIVTTLAELFESRKVALLLPENGQLAIVAYAGEPLSDEELHDVRLSANEPASVVSQSFDRGTLLVISLTAAAHPIGLLVLSGKAAVQYDRETLMIFANQIALAVERAQLREEALRARLAEEVGQLSKTLVAAVSHDLRAPLALIKASSSTLSDSEIKISVDARRSLAQLIDRHADQLADLVQSLLDMSRIQAGVLEPRCTITSLSDLVKAVVRDLKPAMHGHEITIDIPEDLAPVDVDIVLISRVLTNLLTNAARHSPKSSSIKIEARPFDETSVEVSVTDEGPGVPLDQRGGLFGVLARRSGDAGAGLGLTIARTFVEAHGQHIWIDDATDVGARFCFTLPIAPSMPEELISAEDSHH
ncbi:MAG: ATP-binding protein [Acidimicrobiales bacterium]